MITGQNAQRTAYAQLAIKNFYAQDYQLKNLIIINQSSTPLSTPSPIITERMVGTTSLSLGALRNLALEMVPLGQYFTTWDDDDLRTPTYLSDFVAALRTTASIPALTSRYEYNKISGLTWVANKPSGFVLFLAPVHPNIRYLDKATMEDVDILDIYQKTGYRVVPIHNQPNSYVRLVHGNNTSLYVDVAKDYMIESPQYYERPTTPAEKDWIGTVMQAYVNA